MGFIIDTEDDLLGLERRRSSFGILDLSRMPEAKRPSNHIFAYADGEIEMSNVFLNRLITWFEQHPKDRNELAKRARERDPGAET